MKTELVLAQGQLYADLVQIMNDDPHQADVLERMLTMGFPELKLPDLPGASEH